VPRHDEVQLTCTYEPDPLPNATTLDDVSMVTTEVLVDVTDSPSEGANS
jgi:hypothetical protein